MIVMRGALHQTEDKTHSRPAPFDMPNKLRSATQDAYLD